MPETIQRNKTLEIVACLLLLWRSVLLQHPWIWPSRVHCPVLFFCFALPKSIITINNLASDQKSKKKKSGTGKLYIGNKWQSREKKCFTPLNSPTECREKNGMDHRKIVNIKHTGTEADMDGHIYATHRIEIELFLCDATFDRSLSFGMLARSFSLAPTKHLPNPNSIKIYPRNTETHTFWRPDLVNAQQK